MISLLLQVFVKNNAQRNPKNATWILNTVNRLGVRLLNISVVTIAISIYYHRHKKLVVMYEYHYITTSSIIFILIPHNPLTRNLFPLLLYSGYIQKSLDKKK